jgi:hypothetical protein
MAGWAVATFLAVRNGFPASWPVQAIIVLSSIYILAVGVLRSLREQ